jgi:uncharacterized protein (DUF2141 family)
MHNPESDLSACVHCAKSRDPEKDGYFIKVSWMIAYLITGLLITGQFVCAQTVKLNVTVTNIKDVTGVMVISLYNKESSFPIDGKEFRINQVKVVNRSVSTTFSNLVPGVYAVALFHDQNADGICNLGLFGIPKEGFGFSRNFRPKWSAPTYNDCKIEILKDMEIAIDLVFR